jgi:hypothetical protein
LPLLLMLFRTRFRFLAAVAAAFPTVGKFIGRERRGAGHDDLYAGKRDRFFARAESIEGLRIRISADEGCRGCVRSYFGCLGFVVKAR